MKHYHVRITRHAMEKLNGIRTYIAVHLGSPMTAERLRDRLIDSIERLSGSPNRFKVVDFEPEHSRGIRRMNVGGYAVFFVVDEDTVIVLNILHGMMDIQKRLHEETRR